MITATAFVVAAAAGALARTEAGRRWNRHDGFPLGTLLVNLSGSFLLGLLAEATSPMATVMGAGALGAYTTFSSFARDTVALAENGKFSAAAVYVAVSCAGGGLAAAAGVGIANL
ncbi:MAG: fluoride efflux transporter FluC [Acidimicrobiales bacterium]